MPAESRLRQGGVLKGLSLSKRARPAASTVPSPPLMTKMRDLGRGHLAQASRQFADVLEAAMQDLRVFAPAARWISRIEILLRLLCALLMTPMRTMRSRRLGEPGLQAHGPAPGRAKAWAMRMAMEDKGEDRPPRNDLETRHRGAPKMTAMLRMMRLGLRRAVICAERGIERPPDMHLDAELPDEQALLAAA